MTRRIALAILLTVWAMLIASGAIAYLTTRSVMLADLDATLLAQASALQELVPAASARERSAAPFGLSGAGTSRTDGDRYVIQHATDRATLRPANVSGSSADPKPITASFATIADGTRVRTITVSALAKPPSDGGQPIPVIVTYSRSADRFDRLLNRLAITLAACGGAAGLLAAGLAYRVSQTTLRPLRRTADIVGTIDEANLNRRIDVKALPAELLPMGERLNEMLVRVQQSFAQRRQFLADASHELRTPVAALVTGLEVALARPREAEAYRQALADALQDSMQLRQLVERLMQQVRSENFSHDEPPRDVDVSGLLSDCADVAQTLGHPRGIEVKRKYPSGLRLATQAGRLRSVLSNLVSNAVEYNRPGGCVEISAATQDGGVEFTVRDTGPGIAPDELPHLFEPFYRGDGARRNEAGHLGLGLFLVRSHLKALGGRCTVESLPGQGSTFHLHVPRSAQAAN
jgi:two-component system heavy metal sensor histidine kinase CusS